MLTRQRLNETLSRISQQIVLVVGDVMLDEYLWGEVERISPEAPVQVVDVQREFVTLGGAANVVANIISLGGQVRIGTVIGQDAGAEALLSEFARWGVPTEGIFQDPSRPTTRKTRILAASQQVLRIDREVRCPISPLWEEKIVDYVREHLSESAAIILSDYQKGVLTDQLLRTIINLGRDQGKPVFVDPKGISYQKYHKAHYITPNQKEAGQAAGMLIRSEEDVRTAGEKLLRELELEGVVITRGKDGISLIRRGHEPMTLPTRAREVFDVSGAGDTALAALTLGYLAGLELDEAAELANLAAGVVVGKVGTATVTGAEILAACAGTQNEADQKIRTLAELTEIVCRCRLKGQRIVFTNGCFDLLHVGHIKLLHEARSFGDVLIVAVNDDHSIRRLKGPNRPCMGQEERARLLSALTCVDYVVIFQEDTPHKLIAALKPDVLVKGADYRKSEVVGWEIVERYGGVVKLVDLEQNISTSSIIAKILSHHQPQEQKRGIDQKQEHDKDKVTARGNV
ncbi:MAG: D-glycero-beta-D-manno-heptose-7-phosphate kinase [bacterium]|nr:D-glycero-beta-D-manno-heptose-7-phosphate kinase [bacterium]